MKLNVALYTKLNHRIVGALGVAVHALGFVTSATAIAQITGLLSSAGHAKEALTVGGALQFIGLGLSYFGKPYTVTPATVAAAQAVRPPV